jgi:hypothetical protein
LGSSLSPAELARQDSGVFVEMKRLFSIAPKDGTEGEVTEVIIAIFRATDAGFAGVRRSYRVWCFALGDASYSLCDGRWSQERRTLTSASVGLPSFARY